MIFYTLGNRNNPTILFFHAKEVTGESGYPVARYLCQKHYCIMPTSTMYCPNQQYLSKTDKI